MRFNKSQKILISLFLIIFLFSIFYFLFFDRVLADSADVACDNYNYPWCGGDKPTGIADLVGKFYGYALAIVGVAALGAIIYGGILHTVSAGNASAQTEAKDWIWGAVMGVALLLGAYLLLNTINPELVKLNDPSKLINKQTIKKEKIAECGPGTPVTCEKDADGNYKLNMQPICAVLKSKTSCEINKNCFWTLNEAQKMNQSAGRPISETGGICGAK